MGFGTIVTHIMMFIGAITIAAGLLVIITNIAEDATNTINQRQSDFTTATKTIFTLTTVSYTDNTLRVYAQNTGEEEIRQETLDLFLNGERISRNDYTKSIEEDTQVSNTETWSPEEVILLEYEETLSPGRYTVLVNTELHQEETEISI